MWRDRWIWVIFALSAFYDWLTFVTLGPLNSDEVHNGLAAFQFLDGEWILFAAQKHLGSIPALLNAPLIWLFGTEDWVLRLLNLGFRRLDLLLVYGAVRLLMGRRAALAGALIFAFPSRILVGTLLLAINYGLSAFLWLLGIFLLCLAMRDPSRSVLCGLGIGIASGLALWTTPLSLVVIAPLLCAFPLLADRPKALWKRAAVVFGAGLAASLPWWHYNLWVTWLGSLRTDIAMIPPVSGFAGWLSAALDNWSYYAAQVIPSALSPSARTFEGWLNSVSEFVQMGLNTVVLALPLLLALLLIRSGRLPHRSALRLLRSQQRTPASELQGHKRAVFWWGAVLGSILLWIAAVGMTYPGTIRGQVARYAMPFLIWIPFLAGRCALQMGRGWGMAVLTVWLLLPALQDTANFQAYRQNRLRLDHHVEAIRQHIQAQQATYVAGDYWDVFAYTYWTGRQTIGVALAPNLAPRQDLPFLEWRPRRGQGLLLIRDGSVQAQELAVRQEAGLERLPSPDGFSLYRIPLGSSIADSIGFR